MLPERSVILVLSHCCLCCSIKSHHRTCTPIIRALAKIGDVRALDALLAIAASQEMNNESGRREAIDALCSFSDSRALPTLIAALTTPGNPMQPGGKVSAIKALGNINDPAVVMALLPFLDDKNPLLRVITLHSIGHTQNTRAFDAIVPLLKDKNKLVFSSAIDALAQTPTRAASSPASTL